MTRRRWSLCLGATCVLVLAMLAWPAIPAQAATPVLHTNRTAFEEALGTTVTDDYGTPPYPAGFAIYSDVAFSAFLGETDYHTTGHTDHNMHLAADVYCAGCNGSFELSFLTTSVTQSGTGVYGVGMDLVASGSGGGTYYAFITYGDGTTDDVALPAVARGQPGFFGVTAPIGRWRNSGWVSGDRQPDHR
jgi:hypothetical protein